MKKKLFFFAIAVLAFASCKKEDTQLSGNNPDNQIDKADIYVQNNILSFKNREVFEKCYTKLITMSREQSEVWESSLGFVSQRSVFNKIVDAENEWDAKCRKLSKEVQQTCNPHSATYYNYLNKGLIKVVDKGTSDETYNYSVCNPIYTCVLNEEGLVIINDSIYQLSNAKIKIITDGDLNKIKLLTNTSQTDINKNIVVSNAQNQTTLTKGEFDWSANSVWVSSGTKRICMSVTFASNLYGGGANCSATHNVNVQCEEKNWLGSWKKVFTNTTISGNWKSRLKLQNYQNYDYSPTYYYYGSINNFWASVSPTISNSTAPYPSSFSYTAPSGNLFWYELDVYNANWSATRNGGSSGLTATVSHY